MNVRWPGLCPVIDRRYELSAFQVYVHIKKWPSRYDRVQIWWIEYPFLNESFFITGESGEWLKFSFVKCFPRRNLFCKVISAFFPPSQILPSSLLVSNVFLGIRDPISVTCLRCNCRVGIAGKEEVARKFIAVTPVTFTWYACTFPWSYWYSIRIQGKFGPSNDNRWRRVFSLYLGYFLRVKKHLGIQRFLTIDRGRKNFLIRGNFNRNVRVSCWKRDHVALKRFRVEYKRCWKWRRGFRFKF